MDNEPKPEPWGCPCFKSGGRILKVIANHKIKIKTTTIAKIKRTENTKC